MRTTTLGTRVSSNRDDAAFSKEAVAPRDAVLRQTFVVRNPKGLHARPAKALVEAVRDLDAEVVLRRTDGVPGEASGRSILSLLILAASAGTPLEAEVRGPQRHEAMKRLEEVFRTVLSEDAGA